jgi:RNase H-fold protein (predicted Holliday junction resolvase)
MVNLAWYDTVAAAIILQEYLDEKPAADYQI